MEWEITATTAMLGVLGDPVRHSLSPLFQNRFLRMQNEDAVYLAWHVSPSRLKEALAGLHALGARGLNITLPHKEAALELSCEQSQAASAIGAANTLIRTEHGWRAENTDWIGFQRAVERLGGLQGSSVLVFGAGGVARAVVYACAQAGAKKLWLCNRTPERAQALAKQARAWGSHLAVEVIPWAQDAVQKAAAQADGVVQTTSLGLHGEPFPFSLAGNGWALDCVYLPTGATDFVAKARKSGRIAEDGLRMLIEQGAEAFLHWFGTRPDADATFDWLARRLGRAVQEAA